MNIRWILLLAALSPNFASCGILRSLRSLLLGDDQSMTPQRKGRGRLVHDPKKKQYVSQARLMTDKIRDLIAFNIDGLEPIRDELRIVDYLKEVRDLNRRAVMLDKKLEVLQELSKHERKPELVELGRLNTIQNEKERARIKEQLQNARDKLRKQLEKQNLLDGIEGLWAKMDELRDSIIQNDLDILMSSIKYVREQLEVDQQEIEARIRESESLKRLGQDIVNVVQNVKEFKERMEAEISALSSDLRSEIDQMALDAKLNLSVKLGPLIDTFMPMTKTVVQAKIDTNNLRIDDLKDNIKNNMRVLARLEEELESVTELQSKEQLECLERRLQIAKEKNASIEEQQRLVDAKNNSVEADKIIAQGQDQHAVNYIANESKLQEAIKLLAEVKVTVEDLKAKAEQNEGDILRLKEGITFRRAVESLGTPKKEEETTTVTETKVEEPAVIERECPVEEPTAPFSPEIQSAEASLASLDDQIALAAKELSEKRMELEMLRQSMNTDLAV